MISLKSIAPIATILCLCLNALSSFAQDRGKNSFGKITAADFALPVTPIIDSNAGAVILTDKGEVHYVGSKNGWFSYVYTRQTRIKILNKRAIDLATVKVNLYAHEEVAEKLSNVSAATYNLENGQIAESKMDSKDMFKDKLSRERVQLKFSLPGVKEGSIIEYSYRITSDYWWLLPSWEFQSEKYPCLASEFQVEIPQTLSFVFVRQGVHPFAVDNGSEGHASYDVTQKADQSSALAAPDHNLIVNAVTVKHDWVMKNVPAFGEEGYLTTPGNYIDKIDFQLSGTYNGEEASQHSNTWAKATDELLDNEEFGRPLQEDNQQIDVLADKIATDGGDKLAEAKTIYYYVSHHFTCTENHHYLTGTLQDVIRKSSGTVGDINLLLIALLHRKGYLADPVILSTRDHGFNLATYPVLQKMNYVIVRLNLNGNIYYLDAARPELGFGHLSGACYNGAARIISKRDSGSVYFEADSLKEREVTMVLVSMTDKGVEGTWQSTPGAERSYEVRRSVSEHGQQQYFKDIQTRFGEDMEITNGGIDSLDRLEEPIKLHYDFVLKQAQDASVVYLNPLIGAGWRKNPFGAAERKYPVELPYAMDEVYVFSMEVPQGWVVDELPKSARIVLSGDQGQFEYLVAQQQGQVQMRCRLRLNKAWFPAADYSSLRDFFALVVKKEAETIVLKKK